MPLAATPENGSPQRNRDVAVFRKASGFTLLELLVSLVIISLVVGAAVPAGKDWISRYQARRDSAVIYDRLMRLRLHAIYAHRPTTLCPSTDQHGCDPVWHDGGMLMFVDRNADGQVQADDEIITYSPPAHPDTRLLWRSFRRKPYVQMNASGATNSLNGTLVYCPAGRRLELARRFVINRTGRIRVEAHADMNAETREEVRRLCMQAY